MKNKTLLILMWSSSFLIIVATALAYILKFFEKEASNDPEKWGQFGDYFGGICNPLLSMINLIILAYISIRLAKIDDDRNHFTLQELARPFGDLGYDTHTNKVTLTLYNHGLGPMVVKSIKILNNRGDIYKDFIPLIKTNDSSIKFSVRGFHIIGEYCVIGKEKSLEIFSLEGEQDDPKYMMHFEKCRRKISEFSIEIEYSDMYGRVMPKLSEKLNIIDIAAEFD
ncbi:hypothetical protein ACI6PS_02165 [Flavobacterium sp. PLA-1-15]|uniref:hypothetical protein n=1 Tax=Flavobacterium sp. PLA-1-15 TaxID=3380533 RepID=UPI003B76FDE5